MNSYKAVWLMENKIGLDYKGAEIARNRLIANGALSIWTSEYELLQRSRCFTDFEQSLSERNRLEVIRATIRDAMKNIGVTFPFDGMTTSGSIGGRTFPWLSYLTLEEYRQIAQDMACRKSIFAQKAWWIRDYAQLDALPGL